LAPLVLTEATADDAAEIAAVRNAAADHLTERYGNGYWTSTVSGKGVLGDLRRRMRVFTGRRGARIVVTLALQTRKPWAIDTKYFTPCQRPIYLTNMAVRPESQRQGIGRKSLELAIAIARDWRGDAVRLDAYDADAGAGGFYLRCGFREVGRVVYKRTPLRYFEWIIE
jgi:GNAT superfamily N-acetyltransferase